MRARRFAVVGDPVGHSKSPVMQGAAMRALGLPHTYEALHATASELPGVIARLRDGTYDGLNVTVPHKERVLSLVDALDESARVAGAANTIVRGDDVAPGQRIHVRVRAARLDARVEAVEPIEAVPALDPDGRKPA